MLLLRCSTLTFLFRCSFALLCLCLHSTNKPKGFAFVEFSSAEGLQGAIKKHHTQLAKRKINVELTAGGGGNKSESRKAKLSDKNKKLDKERDELNKKRKEKEDGKVREGLAAVQNDAKSANPHNRPAAAAAATLTEA